jgi:hypothetical protein
MADGNKPKEGNKIKYGKGEQDYLVYKNGKWVYGDGKVSANQDKWVKAWERLEKADPKYGERYSMADLLSLSKDKDEKLAATWDKVRNLAESERKGFDGEIIGEGKKYEGQVTKPNVPQRTTTESTKKSTQSRGGTGGGGGIVSKEAETPTRETPTTTGIATKSLTGEGLAGVLQRSSDRVDANMPDIKQGSVKELVDTTQEGGLKSELGKLSGLAEFAPDAFRMGLGLLGAAEKVPEYEIPQEFMDYKSKLREMSTQGLSEQELSNAYKDAERSYAYNVKGIRDMAGGRAGVGLANLGAATTNLGRAYEDINVADASMRRQNLGMYSSALGSYVNLDRQQFDDRRNLALMNKQAGAQLAATALSDMQGRADYNKTYGSGSIYEDYMKQMTEGLRLQNEIYQYQLEHPLDLESGTYAPPSISTDTQVSPYTAPLYFTDPYLTKYGG